MRSVCQENLSSKKYKEYEEIERTIVQEKQSTEQVSPVKATPAKKDKGKGKAIDTAPTTKGKDVKNNNAINHGQTDIYTAVDTGTFDKKGRIRKTSTREYYHRSRYNLATQKRLNHQQKHQAYFNIISKVPSLKTSGLTDYF
ncbi:uncharacterized protein BX663DRAFT_490641 [Cokeromyces recurvatus]|uniref:uncharacterized protein n=1 Tax=Cokeromyces recurvatus TaxID=90255 RepID=UPI00221F4A09|nr:uncharacterized protein BX663DRAFT_490641 [Cokeromyces recurvatus]KAI7897713.1 hypothetical protein BX663DRAFT_490641 [Cokeromyces recurvatus]